MVQSGGAILNQGILHISNSRSRATTASSTTAGRSTTKAARSPFRYTTFTNNSATYGLGGAIDNSGTLNVDNSTFTGGVAFEGGAIDNKAGVLSGDDEHLRQQHRHPRRCHLQQCNGHDHRQHALQQHRLPGWSDRQRPDRHSHVAQQHDRRTTTRARTAAGSIRSAP